MHRALIGLCVLCKCFQGFLCFLQKMFSTNHQYCESLSLIVSSIYLRYFLSSFNDSTTIQLDHLMLRIQQRLLYFQTWCSSHLVASLVFLQNICQSFSVVGVCISALSHLLFFCVLFCFASTINWSLSKELSQQLTHPKHSSVNVYTYYLKIDHLVFTIVVKLSQQRSFSILYFLVLLLLSENFHDSFEYQYILHPSIHSVNKVHITLLNFKCVFNFIGSFLNATINLMRHKRQLVPLHQIKWSQFLRWWHNTHWSISW